MFAFSILLGCPTPIFLSRMNLHFINNWQKWQIAHDKNQSLWGSPFLTPKASEELVVMLISLPEWIQRTRSHCHSEKRRAHIPLIQIWILQWTSRLLDDLNCFHVRTSLWSETRTTSTEMAATMKIGHDWRWSVHELFHFSATIQKGGDQVVIWKIPVAYSIHYKDILSSLKRITKLHHTQGKDNQASVPSTARLHPQQG
jgi:hypothetical protein